jgi:hypothetical protein
MHHKPITITGGKGFLGKDGLSQRIAEDDFLV